MIFFKKRREEEQPLVLQEPTENDVNIHANSNVYKDLARLADEKSRENQRNTTLDNGWTVKDNYFDPKSNFKGVLYEKNGQYALAFAGTEKPTLKSLGGWKDWGANLKMGITGKSRQIDLANEFAQSMMRKYKELNSTNTIAIGHSEGGTEATHVGLNNGLKTYTYNGFGIFKRKFPQGVDTSNIINYRSPYDPVSKLHANVGRTYIVPEIKNGDNEKRFRSPFGTIKAHRLENMGDIQYAIPVKKYKEEHDGFIDKLSDAEITSEDVGLMDSVTFAFYEPEINKRLKQYQIFPSSYLSSRNVPYINGINGSRGYYRRLS